MLVGRTRVFALSRWGDIGRATGWSGDLAAFATGAWRRASLPERVRRDIEREQEAGEVIIGWMQAAVVVFFATLYAVSPKAFPAGTPFHPVPWTLAIYALFTAGRLFLAYRGRLRRGSVVVSVVVDITVLMFTIWSFHLQYQAPPALYLKAPTLMYVFIFIALRTLRFEPAYVLLAGGCAALGWLGLRTIDDLADTAERWRQERQGRGLPAPAVGIAGAVGEIVFGTVEHPTRLEYTVIGEVVNLVAKLEKHTKTEGVRALTTGDSYALALVQGYRPARPGELRRGRTVEGVADPVDVVVLA